MQKQTGAALLIITVILLIAALLSMMYATTHGIFQQKTASNQYQHNQAFEAAQAGLEFGLVYLSAHSTSIIGSASGGYINYGSSDTNITNITLANSSKYSVVYTNPTQNDYSRLTITSTGTSSDGTSSQVVSEQVSKSSSGISAATLIGSITTNGHGGNITANSAVDAGGTVDPNAVASGTIIASDSSLSSLTGDQLFTNIFGVSKATKQSQSTYYASAGMVPWATVSGSIWVNGNVSLAGNTTSGSVASPVTVIVNGTFSLAGNATINGIVYSTGDASMTGNGTVNGLMVSEGNMNFAGNGALNFNTSIVNNLVNNGSILGSYVIIPGSWKDF